MEERLRYLFKKYMDNTCSQPELEEFLNCIEIAENDEPLRRLIRKVYDEIKSAALATPHVNKEGRLVISEPEWTTTAIPIAEETSTNKKRFRTAYIKYLVAAMIFMIGGSTILLVQNRNKKASAVSSLTKKDTDRSESRFMLLEDSTQVWLNVASSIEYPAHFDKKSREVYLTGEAYFDVKHADKIPFVIHTGKISTTVLGTAFNIKAYPGQKNTTISVNRGKVSVARNGTWIATLTKGQQVKLNQVGNDASSKTISAEMVAGWQQGVLTYDDEPLADIISDMERLYNVNIHVQNAALLKQNISTSFNEEIGVSQALQVLCKLTDTQLSVKNNEYTIQ